jgi:aspartate/tyrosine/aromatic aminotransferase
MGTYDRRAVLNHTKSAIPTGQHHFVPTICNLCAKPRMRLVSQQRVTGITASSATSALTMNTKGDTS